MITFIYKIICKRYFKIFVGNLEKMVKNYNIFVFLAILEEFFQILRKLKVTTGYPINQIAVSPAIFGFSKICKRE